MSEISACGTLFAAMSAATARALSIEALFIGAYFVLREHVHPSGYIPKWLAVGFLAVVLLDLWAVWFKLRAVRYELRTDDPVIPGHIVILSLVSCGRIAVFGVMTLMAIESLTGASIGEPDFTYLVMALMAKEALTLYVLGSRRAARRPAKKPWAAVVYLADVLLVLSAEFVLLLLDELFRGPALDTAWNPIFFVVMCVLSVGLFLLFVLPFRILYSFESLRGSAGATFYELASVLFLAGSMLWFVIYDSESAHAHFLEALAANGTKAEFVYEHPTRIRDNVLETLCERPSLTRLRMRCEHVGYVPECVYALPKLEALDLRDNDIERAFLQRGPNTLRHVDLSGNRVRHLSSLGLYDEDRPSHVERLDLSYNAIESVGERLRYAPDLVWLDLSHNPLQHFEVPEGALKRLRTLRLQGTLLSEKAKQRLRERLPEAQIEF